MQNPIEISGFADEISPDFGEQLRVVRSLGMHYLSLRSADGKGIADYTEREFTAGLLPRLQQAGVGVSSLGSPIGKIMADDEEAFDRQIKQLRELCRICHAADCRYIRIFSFYLRPGASFEDCRPVILEKLERFVRVAEQENVVLLHENEKEIYGDTGLRCRDLMETLGGPNFRLAFDPANFVQCGQDPLSCWEMLHSGVAYIHIKDASAATGENVPCGTGDGRIEEILARALREGYRGFLTLEPHLVRFDSLATLEHKAASEVIRHDKAKSGAEAYAMQYHALADILQQIKQRRQTL